MNNKKGIDSKEEFYTSLIDKIFDLLKIHDLLYIELLQSLLGKNEEDGTSYGLEEIGISLQRMKHATVIFFVRNEGGTDYFYIDETARQTWRGWKKWKEELKDGVLMPVKLNNQNFVKLQKELSNYDLNQGIKLITLVIAALGFIISIISIIIHYYEVK
jgi:hypothetical protein